MSPELSAAAQNIIEQISSSVVMPAGCGKTELLAASAILADRSSDKRPLTLTHTHAGVDSVRRRVRALGGPAQRVFTIDSWMQAIVRHFPTLANYTGIDGQPDYPTVHAAAAVLLANPHVMQMLSNTYGILLVDEYQDCSPSQHAVVQLLSQNIPTVIFGDPMQGIFSFPTSPIIDWDTDLGDFTPVEVELTPWRWRGHNPELGEWLLRARQTLMDGGPLDLAGAPLEWREDTPANRVAVLHAAASRGGQVFALERMEAQCVAAASMMGGRYGVMEPIEAKVIQQLAAGIDSGDGRQAVKAVIDFVATCLVRMPPGWKAKALAISAGGPAPTRASQLRGLLDALFMLKVEISGDNLVAVFDEIAGLSGPIVIRREAWDDARRAILKWRSGDTDLTHAVERVRDRVRIMGRRHEQRSFTRTLLVKGLESDECIVLAADSLTPKELYVALSRPRKRLIVLSQGQVLNSAGR